MKKIKLSLTVVCTFVLLVTCYSQIRINPTVGINHYSDDQPLIETSRRFLLSIIPGLEISYGKFPSLIGYYSRKDLVTFDPFPPSVSRTGFEFTERFIENTFGLRYKPRRVIYTAAYFRQDREDINNHILSPQNGRRTTLFQGVRAGVGIPVDRMTVHLLTNVYLNPFAALVGRTNYQLQVIRSFGRRNVSPTDSLKSSVGRFQVGVFLFPGSSLDTRNTEVIRRVAWAPRFGYELSLFNNRISLYTRYSYYLSLNFGNRGREVKGNVIASAEIGVRHYFKGNLEKGCYVGLAYLASRNSSREIIEPLANNNVKGINISSGIVLSPLLTAEVSSLLNVSNAESVLVDEQYINLGLHLSIR